MAKIEKMKIDEKYMRRCLQLAMKGRGATLPNPMVGAVIVENGEIIGEGYHQRYGGPHAEVNAINSVVDKGRLSNSTIYVSLEPCAHYGKTPPCAELIVSSGIPRVVVATTDPNPAVAGKGIDILRNAGVEVATDVLKYEAMELNRVFITNQVYKRPYVVLKWAQSVDGFMDVEREVGDNNPAVQFSNDVSSVFVHKLRTEIKGIMVGTNTAFLDNPRLTSRNWFGSNPTRIVVDRVGRLSSGLSLFDGEVKTIVFTELDDYPIVDEMVVPFVIDFSHNVIIQILNSLYEQNISSVMVEGGAGLLSSFINEGLWDESFIEVSSQYLNNGVVAPSLKLDGAKVVDYNDSIQYLLKNKRTQNIV